MKWNQHSSMGLHERDHPWGKMRGGAQGWELACIDKDLGSTPPPPAGPLHVKNIAKRTHKNQWSLKTINPGPLFIVIYLPISKGQICRGKLSAHNPSKTQRGLRDERISRQMSFSSLPGKWFQIHEQWRYDFRSLFKSMQSLIAQASSPSPEQKRQTQAKSDTSFMYKQASGTDEIHFINT